MKVFNASLTVNTCEGVEVSDITADISKRLRDGLADVGIRQGVAIVYTLHTTCALFINEFQSALIDDLKSIAATLVPDGGAYRHNDPRYSDCERGNAAAHLRTALLGRNIAVAVQDGELWLGRFQSIIFAEFDGPRKRDIAIQVIGA
jgi:secondary thiamine-phosphate synthase enzyme